MPPAARKGSGRRPALGTAAPRGSAAGSARGMRAPGRLLLGAEEIAGTRGGAGSSSPHPQPSVLPVWAFQIPGPGGSHGRLGLDGPSCLQSRGGRQVQAVCLCSFIRRGANLARSLFLLWRRQVIRHDYKPPSEGCQKRGTVLTFKNIYLFEREMGREIFHLVEVHRPNAHSSKGLARSKPRVRDSFSVPHVSGRDQALEPSTAQVY